MLLCLVCLTLLASFFPSFCLSLTGSSFFLGKVTPLGVLCCFALCLFDLSCFFLPSFSSLIKTCTVRWLYISLRWLYIFLCSDKTIRQRCGPDAIVYLSLERHIIVLFAVLSFFSLVVILPINIYGGESETCCTGNYMYMHVYIQCTIYMLR